MIKPMGGVALNRKGLKLKNDPSTTDEEWAAYWEQIRLANDAYHREAFRAKCKDKIRVNRSTLKC